jgi:aminoglycoside/choline kinase family phosphotransferase
MMPARQNDAASGTADDEEVATAVTRLLGRGVSELTEIAPGLGTRRFLRARLADGAPQSVIVRIEDPASPTTTVMGIAAEPPLEPLRSFLETAGLPVPRRYGTDPEHGIEILEDVGERSLETASHELSDEARRRLYHAACALIPRLQALRASASEVPAFGRHLDARLIATKARKLVEWTLPVVFGRAATPAERDVVESAFARIGAVCESAPGRLAHRDFKAANLHVRSDESLVMIDLQGAFLAPPEYDAVCLLRDSHVLLPEPEVEAHAAWLRAALPDAPSADEFARRFDLITLVRVAKDLSHYLDAAHTRGDRRYLQWTPTALANLRAAAARAGGRESAYLDLAELFETIAAHPSQAIRDASGSSDGERR